MKAKFQPLIKKGLVSPDFAGSSGICVEELRDMGIDSLAKLETIIPKDFVKKAPSSYAHSIEQGSNFIGVVRDILLIYDADAYFRKAWKHRWKGIDRETVVFVGGFGVDLGKFIKKFGLDKF
jgi:hypothetical protein